MLVFTQQCINIESSSSSPHTYSPQLSSEFGYLWSGDSFSIFLYLYFLFSQTLYFGAFRRLYTIYIQSHFIFTTEESYSAG